MKRRNLPPDFRFGLPKTRADAGVQAVIDSLYTCRGIVSEGRVLGHGDLSVVFTVTPGVVGKLTVDTVAAEIGQRVLDRDLPKTPFPDIYTVYDTSWLYDLEDWSSMNRTVKYAGVQPRAYLILREDIPDSESYETRQHRAIVDSPEQVVGFYYLRKSIIELCNRIKQFTGRIAGRYDVQSQTLPVREQYLYEELQEHVPAAMAAIHKRAEELELHVLLEMLDLWEEIYRLGYLMGDPWPHNFGRNADDKLVWRDMGSALNFHPYDLSVIRVLPRAW